MVGAILAPSNHFTPSPDLTDILKNQQMLQGAAHLMYTATLAQTIQEIFKEL